MRSPLTLDLLRHGHALQQSPGGDRGRPLSPAGRREIEALARRLAREGTRYNRALASPLKRAAESAALLLAALAAAPAVETFDALTPESSPTDLLAALRDLGLEGGHVLLVGHQPLLGQSALVLTRAETAFAPGTLARIECPRGLAAGAGRGLTVLHPESGG